MSRVAERRSRFFAINAASPGSYTGARPAASAATLLSSKSTPTTVNPLCARHAASGAPNLPKPTTETCVMDCFIFGFPVILSTGQHVVECRLHLNRVFGCKIPINGAMQPVHKFHLRFPTQKFTRERIVGNAIEWTGGHFGMQLDARVASRIALDFADGVNHARAFHRAEIHGGAVVNFFGGENRAADNIAHVRPIAHLFARAPYHIRVLL